MYYISIIGTSGRDNNPLLTKELFTIVYNHCENIIKNIKKNNICLVSGGAPWIDHIAVKLFNNKIVNNLILYTPAEFIGGKFVEKNRKYDGGRILNYYHSKFSEIMEYNTLNDINDAINNGCEIDSLSDNLFERNSEIAKSNYLIAYTFGENIPESKGTLDTWNKCKTNKVHYNLKKLNN